MFIFTGLYTLFLYILGKTDGVSNFCCLPFTWLPPHVNDIFGRVQQCPLGA